MRSVPLRLSRTISHAFNSSRPVHKAFVTKSNAIPARQLFEPRKYARPAVTIQARWFADSKAETREKVADAERRIDDALESRKDIVPEDTTQLRQPQDETIVHTIPESSSIVEPASTQDATSDTKPLRPQPTPSKHADPSLSQRFRHYMDNMQSYIFVASSRLNDLTGYSEIDALKKQIEQQEADVLQSRQAVKDTRSNYTSAIAKRSETQREVNDLLHRKHTWNPSDIERFTQLYRSDHANEQAEAAAQKEVSDAEARYEEASTKLGKTILARYHEEQIWSDKIRQMSTWGTWGLMGLNVLLFVVFQIAIEPWRRRRLVKGFEEKVELALAEQGRARDIGIVKEQQLEPAHEDRTTAAADAIASQIVDAVAGTTGPEPSAVVDGKDGADIVAIENIAEQVATEELVQENARPTESDTPPIFSQAASGFAYYQEAFRELFSERRLSLSQRELTTVALEGAAGGAALMGLLFVLFRPR